MLKYVPLNYLIILYILLFWDSFNTLFMSDFCTDFIVSWMDMCDQAHVHICTYPKNDQLEDGMMQL